MWFIVTVELKSSSEFFEGYRNISNEITLTWMVFKFRQIESNHMYNFCACVCRVTLLRIYEVVYCYILLIICNFCDMFT
jgi:hypothetical protein